MQGRIDICPRWQMQDWVRRAFAAAIINAVLAAGGSQLQSHQKFTECNHASPVQSLRQKEARSECPRQARPSQAKPGAGQGRQAKLSPPN